MQPHCEQSGSPPNWQGVTRVFRSAEMVVVVLAKMQSRGEAGGWANSLIAAGCMSSSGYSSRNRNSSAMARVRCARGQDLRIDCAFLRREDAEPDPFGLFAQAPELDELFQVAFALHHLAGDGAMNADVALRDALQDALVGSRLAADVMLRL